MGIIDLEMLGEFLSCIETLAAQGVRAVLKAVTERRLNVKVNIGDAYRPLDVARLR